MSFAVWTAYSVLSLGLCDETRDIKIFGAGAYLTPLLSTLILVGFGISQASSNLWLASITISAGAMLAASGVLFSKRK